MPPNEQSQESGGAPESKKIFVDEDWKSQVEAEKRAAAERQATEKQATEKQAGETQVEKPAGEQTAAETPAAETPAAKRPPAREGSTKAPVMPPADLPTLVSMLASQAMVSLGVLANPLTKQAATNLPEGRHFVDLIEMLQEKTRGNTTPEEAAMLESLLHELRMAYIAVENATRSTPPA